jgi:hypothetical protein
MSPVHFALVIVVVLLLIIIKGSHQLFPWADLANLDPPDLNLPSNLGLQA